MTPAFTPEMERYRRLSQSSEDRPADATGPPDSLDGEPAGVVKMSASTVMVATARCGNYVSIPEPGALDHGVTGVLSAHGRNSDEVTVKGHPSCRKTVR